MVISDEPGGSSLSVYSGRLTAETVVESITKVRATFPTLSNDFYDIFMERIKDKCFSDKRLKDAVNHVIDTCQYPTPTLANFLSFDKRVRILSYSELGVLVTNGEALFSNYSKIKIAGKPHYVRIADKELFNIPDEL